MAKWKVGLIGCGGRGRGHARGYMASPDVELVACADPVAENAKKLSEEFGVARTYSDHMEMLQKEKPDIVSVCVWTGLHLPLIRDAVAAGVKAIHAEKPMAPTWGDSKEIYRLVTDAKVLTTFCHQRRFAPHYVKTVELLHAGAIGEIVRFEGRCPNMFDWGTHWFDMLFYFNDDEPAESVLAQIDAEGPPRTAFAIPVENQGVSVISYKNGRQGIILTGMSKGPGEDLRIIGTEGVIEILAHRNPPLRMLRSAGSGWELPDLSTVTPKGDDTVLSVLDLIDCLKTGREPKLSVHNAIRATELIFATYESSRSRKRIDLPLQTDDSALLTMLEQGVIGPNRKG